MKVRVPDYYDDFHCLGSECPDTCCVGWVIEIDDESYERFMNIPGEVGEKIRNNIAVNEEGRPYFKLNKNGSCSFLDEKKLCQMYIELGEDSQCALCANYPRIGDEFGALREMGLSISCPEVARIILQHDKKIGYEEWEMDEKPVSVNYCGDRFFEILLEFREVFICIAQSDDMTSHEKLALFIDLAAKIQNAMDNNDYEALLSAADEVESGEYIKKALASFKKIPANLPAKQTFVDGIYKSLENLDFISSKWTETVNRAYEIKNETKNFVFNKWVNIYVYMILRYFMKCIFDGDLYSKIVFIVYADLLLEDICSKICENQEDLIRVTYLFSKEIEHCEENMSFLYDMFWEAPWNDTKNILEVLR